MALPQVSTGKISEAMVKSKLEALGLSAVKPRDVGVDLVVSHPKNPKKKLNIQIKARNKVQDGTYRWFQLRSTKAHYDKIKAVGGDPSNEWKKKVDQCDFFILVSIPLNEMWVLSKTEVFTLINLVQTTKLGSRPDNLNGKQKEMDLDRSINGVPLTTIFKRNQDNFEPILLSIS